VQIRKQHVSIAKVKSSSLLSSVAITASRDLLNQPYNKEENPPGREPTPTTNLRGLRLFCRAAPARLARSSELGNRLFVEAVIWKFRSGAPWHDLPERFGDWKNTHKRFSRWAASGVWESLFKSLADDPDNEYVDDRRHQFQGAPAQRWGP
jgi:transposase